jgi:hypothetical protein
MSWIGSWLTHLKRPKAMFEGESARDSIPRALHNQISQGLVQAMRAGANNRISGNDQDGQVRTAPDQYTLVLPTEQAQLLLSHPANLDRLARMLEISTVTKYHVGCPPILRSLYLT